MKILLCLCISFGVSAFVCKSVALPPEAAAVGEVRTPRQTLLVWNCSQFKAIREELQPTTRPDGEATMFYVHLAGSIDGLFQRSPGMNNWLTIRMLPGTINRGAGALGESWFLYVCERASLKKHLNYFAVDDLVTGAAERVEKDRLYVRFGLRANAREIPLEQWADGVGQILLPKREQAEQCHLEDALVLFGIDRGARFNYMNVSVDIRTNFSDVAKSADFTKAPAEASVPLLAALQIRQYLQRPFPKTDEIVGVEEHLIASFSTAKETVAVGKEIELHLTFGAEALRLIEWVRLRADAGSFRLDEGNIYYKGASKGRQTLVVEAISGTQWNGKVECADRKELKIEVE